MKNAFLLLICFTFQALCAQDTLLIKGNFDSFTTDELGNIYATSDDEIMLYRPDGQFWMRNSIKTIGDIHSMDVFYSLKPMLFSRELQQVAVLDNTLAIQGDLIWLNRRGYPQVTLVASSVQNKFWLFDQLDMQVIRVNRQWEQISASGRIDQLTGKSIEPLEMVEAENTLYVNDPEVGIIVFDLFGTYVKTIPIKGASAIQVRKRTIHYLKNDRLHVYDKMHFESALSDHVLVNPRRFRVTKNYLMYLNDKGIHRKQLDVNNE